LIKANVLTTTLCHHFSGSDGGVGCSSGDHLSAVRSCQHQTTVEVIALAADTTAYPVQGRPYHIQGFVDVCSTVPRQTIAVSRDDAVATVHWRSAPVCSKDTYWDS